jgi:hypothetical protein
MGDRTTVYLDLLASQADAAKKLFDYEPEHARQNGDQFVEFEFHEVNYGTLGFLSELEKAGIAYDSSWSEGDQYGAGTLFGRFTADGEIVRLERYETDIDPSMGCLMKLIDDPVALREYILQHHKETTPLPWDNQEEYGKLYRARMLIST